MHHKDHGQSPPLDPSPPEGLPRNTQKQQTRDSFEIMGLRPCSQLPLPLDIIDDVTLLRRQLQTFARTSLVLGRKIYEQEEKLQQALEEAEQYRGKYHQECSEREGVAAELANLRCGESEVDRQVRLREALMEDAEARQANHAPSSQEKTKQLDARNHDLTLQIQQQQEHAKSQLETIKSKQGEIDALAGRVDQFKKEIKKKKNEEDHLLVINSLRGQLKERNDNFARVAAEVGLLKLENKQLERELTEFRCESKGVEGLEGVKGVEEVELMNLSYETSNEQLRSQIKVKEGEVAKIAHKYKVLKHNYEGVRNESKYLKQRMDAMANDEKEGEHIVLERFLGVLQIYRDKLKEGEAPIRVNLDLKKEAFLRRLTKEYLKFVETVETVETVKTVKTGGP